MSLQVDRPVYLPFLDGLRALAIGLVLVSHAADRDFHLEAVSRLGPLGVDIFFILSGFLITRLLMIEVRRTGRISFENFYIRRFLRLGPALIAMFAVYGLLIGLHLLTDLNRATFLYAVLYMRNIKGMGASTGHLWSLSLEEQFYLFWPALFWIAGKRATKIAFALTLAVIAIRMGSILHSRSISYLP